MTKMGPVHASSKIARVLRTVGVRRTAEFERIRALPRRVLGDVPDLSPVYSKGEGKLWPIQSAALWDAEESGGLFAPIGVGHGKTLITLLLPDAMEAKRPLLFVPAQLRNHLLNPNPNLDGTLAFYAARFRVRDDIRVMSHNELSLAKNTDALEGMKPDLIIIDEAHAFRHRSASRTKRLLRYLKDHPECRMCALSGSMTDKTLLDYAHLIEHALKKRSPVPYRWSEIIDWAAAIDVNVNQRMQPGVLLDLATGNAVARYAAGEDDAERLQVVRGIYRDRLVESVGVVATEEGALGTSLIVSQIGDIAGYDDIEHALHNLRKTWIIGEEVLEDAMAFHRVARQLACGFYYKWDWPGGQPDHEWLEARANWHREVRDFLKRRSAPGMDSPLLLANAASAGRWKSEHWAAWAQVKDRPAPPVTPVWFSDALLADVRIQIEEWGEEPLIVWYEHDAVGKRLAELGLTVFGAGNVKPQESRERVIACSIRAHGTGKNLQHYSQNLLLYCPASGVTWEQLLGRTHRPGQEAGEVIARVYLHTDELETAFETAIKSAAYIQQTTGQKQKLLYATRIA